MSDALNHEILAGLVNTRFAVADAPESFELELVEVTEPTVTASQTFFSAYFLGSENFPLPQGTYRVNHPQIGETFLFLVPTAREENGCKYEAVFNLLNEEKLETKN